MKKLNEIKEYINTELENGYYIIKTSWYLKHIMGWSLLDNWDIVYIKDWKSRLLKYRLQTWNTDNLQEFATIKWIYLYIDDNDKIDPFDISEDINNIESREKYEYFMNKFYNDFWCNIYDYNEDLDILVKEITWYNWKNKWFEDNL